MASKSKMLSVVKSRESSNNSKKVLNLKKKFEESSNSEDEGINYNNQKRFKKIKQYMGKDDDISEDSEDKEDEEELNEESDDEEVENEILNQDEDDVEKKSDIDETKKNKFDDMKNVIKQQLTGMSFEEVMKLQNKLGLKK